MTQDDEIDPQPLRMGNYLIESVAARQIPIRCHSARLQPLD